MTTKKIGNLVATVSCAAGLLTIGLVTQTKVGEAQSTPTVGAPDAALVEKGLQIAPVPVNLTGKDRTKVGYGSYIVNAMGGCNDCHTNPSYDPTGDPFRGMPTKINAAGYLGGGTAFGPFLSRNITPDASGQVAGGLANFKQIFRTGVDLKKLHTPISPLLQVMPWPVYGNMDDRDLESIYEYLSSIPCVEGGPGELPNRCTSAAKTAAIAGPKNQTVVTREAVLDGSKSTSVDGKELQYAWSIPPNNPSAAIRQGNTATPTVQFGTIRGVYTFQLTVTDSKGGTATDFVTVNFAGY